MLDNEAFVFDCVCHVFNFDKRNAFGKPGQMFIDHLYAFHQVLTPPVSGCWGRKSSCASGALTRSRAWSLRNQAPT